jgi:hypothetical protein
MTQPFAIACADCGCLVERGERVAVCDDPQCCCVSLPTRSSAPPDAADSKPPHADDILPRSD